MKLWNVSGIWLLALAASLSGTAKAADVLCRDSYGRPFSDRIVVRFTYGSEKEKWIHERTTAFNANPANQINGKRVCVEALAKGSGDSTKEIETMVNPTPDTQVDITSPASALFVELTNARYGAKNNGKKILLAKGNLVRSPIVIAMWESVLKSEFNGNSSNIGWKEIMEKATSNPNFRFGHTQPLKSNSGLAAIVAQFYAGALDVFKKFRSLAIEHVEDVNVQKYVAAVQSTIVHYGESTNFYAENMLANGPANLSAAVVYENLVIEKNETIRSNPKYKSLPKLVAVYPKEGTFISDHPFTIVNASWVDAAKRDAAEIYYAFLMTPESQLKAIESGFKPGLNDIKVPDDLKNSRWNAINGVASYDSEGSESGFRTLKPVSGEVIERILDLWTGLLKKPSDVVVIVDKSGSMNGATGTGGTRIDGARQGVREVVNYLNDKDLMSLMVFSDSASYVNTNSSGRPIIMDVTGKQRMNYEADGIRASGGTYMYDALKLAWEDLCKREQARGAERRIRAIIVLTDGESDEYNVRRADFMKMAGFTGQYARQSGCKFPIFGIAYGSKDSVYSQNLRDISNATGGETVFGEGVDSMKKLFSKLATFL